MTIQQSLDQSLKEMGQKRKRQAGEDDSADDEEETRPRKRPARNRMRKAQRKVIQAVGRMNFTNTSAPQSASQPGSTNAGDVPSDITEGATASTMVTDGAAMNHCKRMSGQVTEEVTTTENVEETENAVEAENTGKTR